MSTPSPAPSSHSVGPRTTPSHSAPSVGRYTSLSPREAGDHSVVDPVVAAPNADTAVSPAHAPESAGDSAVSSGAGGQDASADSSDGSYVSVWGPFVRVVVGLGIIIAALTWSLHFDGVMDRFGYVPVMVVYLIIMIVGGGLMVKGATTLWSRLTSP